MATPPRTVHTSPLYLPPPATYDPPPKVSLPIPPEHYLIEVCCSDPGPPAVVRVRRLLKAARRAYHLRCLSCLQLPKDATTGGGTP